MAVYRSESSRSDNAPQTAGFDPLPAISRGRYRLSSAAAGRTTTISVLALQDGFRAVD